MLLSHVYTDNYKGVRAAEDRKGGKMKLHINWLGLVLQNFYYFIIIDAKYHLSQTVWSVTIEDAVQSQAGTQSLQKPPGKLLPPTRSLLHGADARQVIVTMNKNK